MRPPQSPVRAHKVRVASDMSIASELEQHLPAIFKRVRSELPNRDQAVSNAEFFWDPSELCKAFYLLIAQDFPHAKLFEYTYRLIRPAYIDADLLPPSYAIAIDDKLFDERGLTTRDDVVQGIIDFYMGPGLSDEGNYTDQFETDTHYELPDDESLEVSRHELLASQVKVDPRVLAVCARHLPAFLLSLRTAQAPSKNQPSRRSL
jgi:hypothetical protein